MYVEISKDTTVIEEFRHMYVEISKDTTVIEEFREMYAEIVKPASHFETCMYRLQNPRM